MTQDDFLHEARRVHGTRYDYSEAVFKSMSGKVRIICPDHGPFEQAPRNHLAGSKCLHCAGKAKLTTEQFIANARAVHGDKYDYSATVYKSRNEKVTIICPEHGPFQAKPSNHVNNQSGCPACAGVQRTDRDSFIERARAVHGDKYDYSLVDYKGVDGKVQIICPDHGPFWQAAYDHTKGHGCKECGVDKCASSNRRSLAEFIRRAHEKHGDQFDYSRAVYINSTTPIEIICPDHGPFWQVPQDHITRYGCAACSGLAPIGFDEFHRRATEVHGNTYKYDEGSYRGWTKKMRVLCEQHGEFFTTPKYHVSNSSGCPQCWWAKSTSEGEQELADWVRSLGVAVIQNDRKTLEGFEIDILVPGLGIGIEYNGAYWHSADVMTHPRIHEVKFAAAQKKGIRLITVWDFDWANRRDFIKSALLHSLGKNHQQKIDARKCRVQPVGNSEAAEFYERTHIQGKGWRQIVNYALFDGDRMVACMSFTQGGSRRGKTGDSEWELIRYATDGIVRGGASRLFAAFRREQDPQAVWSFSDRQHFSGALYVQLGFSEDAKLPADYRVFHQASGRQWHKSAWQRRHIQTRLDELGIPEVFDPETDPRTERDMQRIARCMRIMDAGKIRWKWAKKEAAQGDLSGGAA